MVESASTIGRFDLADKNSRTKEKREREQPHARELESTAPPAGVEWHGVAAIDIGASPCVRAFDAAAGRLLQNETVKEGVFSQF
ncbi:hypothetical protein Y032_0237g3260 [Ancylostoma ceylanicum]|uniref:Uncharacterized protein n=1 Tax=Ancylostoma ceylanicum TaxID=53326 RepID=A0A016SFC3_9BILA|nr:hypothetical protein Y032_0237g3260 [Ancylostoma ceylanicum]